MSWVRVARKSPELEALFVAASWEQVRPGVEIKRVEFRGLVLEINRFFCQDCNVAYPLGFMADMGVWHSLGLHGWICLDCFVKRLGRPLDERDLSAAPMNAALLRLPPPRMSDEAWAVEVSRLQGLRGDHKKKMGSPEKT